MEDEFGISQGMRGLGSGLILSKVMDYIVPFDWTPQGKMINAQNEFQYDMTLHREKFQEEMQYRQFTFQKRMEEKKEQLQRDLSEKTLDAQKKIAEFQALAMRQTQMMLAEKNASNLLENQLYQDALRSFPLNVSPLVLLKNQQSQGCHLLEFTDPNSSRDLPIELIYNEVMSMKEHPAALNIFVAPIYIDSRIRNRKILSEQIWDAIYQKIESFFISEYDRNGNHPVVFFPTAWNDKFNSVLHASETLHFFLKDLPCVVMEPRFDGTTFRLMFSAWGIGYNTTYHHRTEMSFPINMNKIIAESCYSRSNKVLNVLSNIAEDVDFKQYGFYPMIESLKRNVDLYEAIFKKNKEKDIIDTLDIYNFFLIDPVNDLFILADNLSSYIGINLAAIADIHHLRSFDANPLLPKLINKYFSKFSKDEKLRHMLFLEYKKACDFLKETDKKIYNTMDNSDINNLKELRDLQFNTIRKYLLGKDDFINIVCKYAKDNYNVETTSLEEALTIIIDHKNAKDVPFLRELMKNENIDKKTQCFIDLRVRNIKRQ